MEMGQKLCPRWMPLDPFHFFERINLFIFLKQIKSIINRNKLGLNCYDIEGYRAYTKHYNFQACY